jgi:Helix-turn-helix domain
MARRINPRLIKLHHSYTVEEASRTLDVHKNTVRGWRAKELKPIDNRKPILFAGKDLRDFLERMNVGRKQPSPKGHFYCFRCRASRRPAMEMVDYVPITQIAGNLKALCAECGTLMHRRARRADVQAVMPGIAVQFPEAQSRLSETVSPSLNSDFQRKG